MGMSTYVRGITSENNPEYQKHLKVYMVCKEAKVSLPRETEKYFNGEDPEYKLEVEIPSRKWNEDMREGIEVIVAQIPSGVEIIRFINSY